MARRPSGRLTSTSAKRWPQRIWSGVQAWRACTDWESVSSRPVMEATRSTSFARRLSGVSPWSGLSGVMGCTTSQVKAKKADWLRRRRRSWARRTSSPSGRALGAQQHQVGLGLGDLVPPLVGHADEQGRDPVEAGDHRVPAEDHPRGGAGELGEDEPGDEGEPEEPDERLEGDEQVRGEPPRRHLAVADGGHGLDAEEEGVGEVSRPRLLDAVADGEVARGEEQVRAQVGDEHQREELGPGGGEERVVDVAQRRGAQADREDLPTRAGQAGDAVSWGSVAGHAARI